MAKRILRNYDLYLMLMPTLAFFFVFSYWPMYGTQIAFKNFMPFQGISQSPWVGWEHFERFLGSYAFSEIFSNTIWLSLYSLAVGFPLPIIMALLLNQIRSSKFKRIVQTVTYAPNFISVMVAVGMLYIFLSPSHGLINQFLGFLHIDPVYFMGKPEYFRHVYVWSGIWQTLGFSMIIYLAALTAIDPSLHEAAIVDGANKWKRILHIDYPGIMPTIMILLILAIGNVMSIGFEKVYLMQTPLNLETSEVIATYEYKMGLLHSDYSFGAAIGLFNSVINFVLLVGVNLLAKRMGKTSLW